MEIDFDREAMKDLEYWKKSGNDVRTSKEDKKPTFKYSGNSIYRIRETEALKYNLSAKWSRRINKEHRVIYSIKADRIQVHSLKGHYI